MYTYKKIYYTYICDLIFVFRATETSEVESLRPPRFFNEDGVIRPYRLRDGSGNQMLQVSEEMTYKLKPNFIT